MITSFIVRLIPEQLSAGHFVGQVESIATGEQITIRSQDELLAALLGSTANDREQEQ